MAWQAILDIAVVLVSIYLVMAAAASGLVELLGSVLNWRGNTLRDGIGRMLGDPRMRSLARRVWTHPLIASQPSGRRGPSYLDSKVFGLALADVVKESGEFDSTVQGGAVGALLRASGNDPAAFRAGAERWFDEGMARVSGAYKRRTHVVMLAFSLAVAALCNIDSIQLVRTLAQMPNDQRSVLSDSLGHAAAAPAPAPDSAPAAGSEADMGVIAAAVDAALGRIGEVGKVLPFVKPDSAMGWAGKIVGWLITAVAAAVGSQFWFGLLGNVVRLSGRRPGA
ncbi:hypothetical protein [Magnetospirillum sp. SS-4]|uniref:hypothetical protein n=1 Tax=Magnetospirillum sp. SS-4 TaxID=2681465 RepID=UPI00137EB38D|nr:hypothetical protein [Magnetospirillum sp. SS-4]CAA7624779.1 conserved membrane hypothetical protein [Magnetospirillum sp. SS-4]